MFFVTGGSDDIHTISNKGVYGTGILMPCFLVKTVEVYIASMIVDNKSIRTHCVSPFQLLFY